MFISRKSLEGNYTTPACGPLDRAGDGGGDGILQNPRRAREFVRVSVVKIKSAANDPARRLSAGNFNIIYGPLLQLHVSARRS